ncbi:MAG: hypothetical protein COZ20_01925 [Gallionellales bacterium CG_4_10_14_3_um_filter_54_96]|nr:MAG: hypothetical protein COW45_07485 [Gallionellales bacterium CG17_big_fil_post_rev_8_21_14_2_50_54_146]PIX05434.1 MAG: hypothetical protein COZ77_01190 [Gallionellales bacterium CG_4_8_14_3_um_filter_54_18]PIY06224.1 MAG: hypothetical protein COZ20_01925 [Gallionellales bacterium CG_4_10_14_3_um_filter_54_96]
MNILWVEDDQQTIQTGIKTLAELMEGGLIDKLDNLLINNDASSENLKRFFQENTTHGLQWYADYGEAKRAITKQTILDWDVVIIDLNLGNGTDGDVNLASAGFALYVQLIRCGFPCDHIVFFTGNQNELNELIKSAALLGIPEPTSFKKAEDKDKEKFKEWVKKYLENDELTLRRGILDGCNWLSAQIREYPEMELRINDFSREEDGKICREEILDWLEIWPKLLPELISKEKKRYTSFLFVLLSLWDKKAKGSAEKGFNLIPYILTHARNWMAHGKGLHNEATPHGMAFIFLLATRGILRISTDEILRHEKILLNIFPKGIEPNSDVAKLKLVGIRKATLSRAQAAIKSLDDNGVERLGFAKIKSGDEWYFNRLANAYVSFNPNASEEAEQLLMQSLLVDYWLKSIESTQSNLFGALQSLKSNSDWLTQLCWVLLAHFHFESDSSSSNE